MKSKKISIIVTVLFSVLFCKAQGQIYFAGQTLSSYTNVNPDTLINYSCGAPVSNESYNLDINNDLLNDFKINADCGYSPGYSSNYISITSLNPNWFIRFGRL